MKSIFFTLTILTASFATQAQELAPDQNPNYKQSMDKYSATQVSLQSTNNTTIQNTYKAYDWSTAKAERQAERRNFRRERQLFNNYNNDWNNNRYNNYYGNNRNRNSSYFNRNNYRYNNCYRWIW